MKCPTEFKRATFGQWDRRLFWQGLDGDRLMKEYGALDPSALNGIQPVWDIKEIGRFENAAECEEYLEECSLYFCRTRDLQRLLANPENYTLGNFRSAGGCRNHFCRVVGHWERGNPLAPVVLSQNADGLFENLDGYHRLVVAFAAGDCEIALLARLDRLPPAVYQVPGNPVADSYRV